MKELAIEQMNRQVVIEQSHKEHIERVYQAGLPLWMADMYSSMEAIYEEVDNQNLENTSGNQQTVESGDGLPF
jgi:hypothetical protein